MKTLVRLVASLWPSADVEARYTAGLALVVADVTFDEAAAAVRVLSVGSPPVVTACEFVPPPGRIRAQVDAERRTLTLRAMLGTAS